MRENMAKSVKRCLFGKSRSPNSSQDRIEHDLEVKNQEWNFDFNQEKPINNKKYVWETLSANQIPKFYSRISAKKHISGRSLRPRTRFYGSKTAETRQPTLRTTQRGDCENKIGLKVRNSKNKIQKKSQEVDPNQKLISQFFRSKPRYTGKIIDLTKTELKPKSEPLCDFTNRTYFQTRATASITTRARRRKLSNEA